MMRAMLIALTSILLFSHSVTPFALPSSSSLSEPLLILPSTVNLTLPSVVAAPEAEDGIICFNTSTEKVFPVDVSDCKDIIHNIMLYDPSGVMNRQKFGHNPQTPGIYAVPKIWKWNRCFVLLTSADEDAICEFRLIDAIVRAQDVLTRCPPNSKHSLGGVAVLEIGTFFVSLDGPPPFQGPNQTTQLGGYSNLIHVNSS